VTSPPQHTCFAESNTERSRRLATLRKRKQRSQCTVEAKRGRREQEKGQTKKARCGESSQARYKLCSLFMLDSTVVVLELGVISDILAPHGQSACAMRTGTARHEASCACVVLVLDELLTGDSGKFLRPL